MPFSAFGKNLMLDAVDEAATNGAKFASLHSAYSTTGTNELAGGSPAYARKALVWAASSAGSKSAAAVTFDVEGGDSAAFVGYWDAVTTGNFLGMEPLSSAANAKRQINVSDAADVTANTIDSPAHGLTAGTQVVFWNDAGAVLPTGLTEGTIYFVIATGLTTDVFSVSTTSGGSAVDITGNGDGTVQAVLPATDAAQFTLQVTPTLSMP